VTRSNPEITFHKPTYRDLSPKSANSMYAGIGQVLSLRGGNPRPNVLEVSLRTLFVVTFFLVFVLRFRGA